MAIIKNWTEIDGMLVPDALVPWMTAEALVKMEKKDLAYMRHTLQDMYAALATEAEDGRLQSQKTGAKFDMSVYEKVLRGVKKVVKECDTAAFSGKFHPQSHASIVKLRALLCSYSARIERLCLKVREKETRKAYFDCVGAEKMEDTDPSRE